MVHWRVSFAMLVDEATLHTNNFKYRDFEELGHLVRSYTNELLLNVII